jgi:hypothetical protein
MIKLIKRLFQKGSPPLPRPLPPLTQCHPDWEPEAIVDDVVGEEELRQDFMEKLYRTNKHFRKKVGGKRRYNRRRMHETKGAFGKKR